MKQYAISCGDYSDYRIECILAPGTTEQQAHAILNKLNAGNRYSFEECRLEEFYVQDGMPKKVTIYCVFADWQEGVEPHVIKTKSHWPWEIADVIGRGSKIMHLRGGQAQVWDVDEKKAIKKIADLYHRKRAEQEGIA